MTSLRHNPEPRDAYLDAARACILDVGWRRTTLTEVARRAGVSRMTIYRTWADVPQLLGDLMTREWAGVVTTQIEAAGSSTSLERLVDGIVGTTRALRDNELFGRIVELDPELVLPYLFARRGRSQDLILALTLEAIEAGQADGSIRAGDPRTMARAVLLAVHGFVLSVHTMADEGVQEDDLDDELTTLLTRSLTRMTTPTHITPGLAGAQTEVDVVVIGLGITGAGVALDAVTRGLSVLAVDAHDLAFGTSRWSSKLVHGGLRYLASGQVGVAHESAVERGVLMEVTAPHLSHAIPTLMPFGSDMPRPQALAARGATWAGDLLRRGARTSVDTLPRPRHLSRTEALQLAPSLRRNGLRGAMLGWDGQLEDDARLVTTVARTAASYGAHVRTRARVVSATGTSVRLRDELTGATHDVSARTVVNATGVWAGQLVEEVRLRPSRGTHLVLREETLPDLRVVVYAPVPGSFNRYVLVLPQPDGTLYVGLTDEPADGPVPDVPQPTEPEIGFLLDVVSAAFEQPIHRTDVVGSFAGLRPLLDVAAKDGHSDQTADISRRHAVLTSRTGVVTIVGGKLTTYRRMAEDAVDAALRGAGIEARPCRTHELPLLGAAPRDVLARLEQPARLVRRFGTDAELVLACAVETTGLGEDELLAPVAEDIPVTLAELVFAVTHEGAADVGDLLDRRTRVGLVPVDRVRAVPAAERALALAAAAPRL